MIMDHDGRDSDAPEPPIDGELTAIVSRQDLSWEEGEPECIEQLLSALKNHTPEGREHTTLALICNEVYHRQRSGDSPTLQEYQERFPEFAKVIAIQWKLDDFFDPRSKSNDSTSRAEIEHDESVSHDEVTRLDTSDSRSRPTPPMHGVPPELLKHPNYRVKRPIGRGGMGTVWLAEQLSMQRMVALKLIRPDLAAKPESIARFRREVQAAARLRHPNIVTAHDAGQVGETHFLVFEYIDGLTLAKCVEHEPLTICAACSAIRDAALGLMHAHAAGLVHRDIKPGNLIRDVDGLVKVLDFGLVVEPSDDSSITGENIVMGTPDYIAPEQADDPRSADARSDIYSLGCTLYHLLSGHAPFKGLSQLKKLDAQRYVTAEPVPNMPQSLQEVVSKMMAKCPQDRYQSASEVVAAITPFCSPQLPTVDLPVPLKDALTSPRVPVAPTALQTLLHKQEPPRRSRRSLVLSGFAAVSGLLLLSRLGCTPREEKEEKEVPPVVAKSSVPFTEPSGFADGDDRDIKIKADRLTLNAMNREQVWLNYKQVSSEALEIRATFKVLETRASEPILKFVFQSPEGNDFHEYSFQLRIRESLAELVRTIHGPQESILDKTNVNLKQNEPTEVRFRIDESGLTAIVDGKEILHAECTRTEYYACVAVRYCSVELSNAQAADVAETVQN